MAIKLFSFVTSIKKGLISLKNKIKGRFSKENQYSEIYLYNAIKAQMSNASSNYHEIDQQDGDSPYYLKGSKTLLMSTYTDDHPVTSKGTLDRLNDCEMVNNDNNNKSYEINRVILLLAQNGRTIFGFERNHWTVLKLEKAGDNGINVTSYDPKSRWGSIHYNRRGKLFKNLKKAKSQLQTIFGLSNQQFVGLCRPKDIKLHNLGVQSMFNRVDCGPYARQIVTDLLQSLEPMEQCHSYNANNVRYEDKKYQVSNNPMTMQYFNQANGGNRSTYGELLHGMNHNQSNTDEYENNCGILAVGDHDSSAPTAKPNNFQSSINEHEIGHNVFDDNDNNDNNDNDFVLLS